jgi:hypothetical protein
MLHGVTAQPQPLRSTSGVENSKSWKDNFDFNLNKSTDPETRGKNNQPSYKIHVSAREGENGTLW